MLIYIYENVLQTDGWEYFFGEFYMILPLQFTYL